MGTMLIAAGLSDREVPESWCLARPEALREIHLAYLEAGARIIQTNTFGGNRVRLASSPAGREFDVVRANIRAAEIARAAVEEYGGEGRLVGGDIGPTGRFLPPVGDLEPETARNVFREQARALESAGVDLFLVETMVDLREALEALRAVREVSERPVLVELTFDRKPRGYFTVMGDTPERAAKLLLAEGADAVGANCTLDGEGMEGLVGEFRRTTDAPLLFQPNAGQPVLREGGPVYEQRPEEFAEELLAIVRAGADLVGGCCGTDPAFIRAARDRLAAEGGTDARPERRAP
jgi:5-methyltetrahydrofolate--homocysteine methyltransferase